MLQLCLQEKVLMAKKVTKVETKIKIATEWSQIQYSEEAWFKQALIHQSSNCKNFDWYDAKVSV